MTDSYDFWRKAIAGQKQDIDADSPQPGYYKLRQRKDGPWLPAAIWEKDGSLVARVGKDSVSPNSIWSYCAGNPVASDAAKQAFETGQWPGDAPAIGGNYPPESLDEQIKEYAAMAVGWLKDLGGKIASQKDADMASNYRAELLRLKKEAEKTHKSEKAPHLEAGRAVDAKWKPVISEADDASAVMRKAAGAFLAAEEERQRKEAHEKWLKEQEAARKEQERIEAERKKKMEDDPIAALTEPEHEQVAPPPPPEPVKVQAGGQRGKRTGLKTVTSYVVVDHAKALAFFADSDDVMALVAKLAERASKAGVDVPGVEKKEERVAV